MTVVVSTGVDLLKSGRWRALKGMRLGLLANQASVDRGLKPTKQILHELLPDQLTALFGPQHGHGGEDQDNMVETDHDQDPVLRIPIFSLYSNEREPAKAMFDAIDVLLIDLQDVGTRVYTFATTMLNCIKGAATFRKKVVILDRPNPLGGSHIEGNLLKKDMISFVGAYPMPMRHGLTMGEMALMFNETLGLEADLEILPMDGWHRDMLWGNTGLTWVMPSPNMPLPETAMVYPGQVLWEGTNLSEGRGTCRPFEMFGAPYLDPSALRRQLDPKVTEGCYLREVSFRPTFHKWENQLCRGFMIHIVDPNRFCPYLTSLALLSAILKVYGASFEWKSPPYEYEYHRMPFDLITGDGAVRNRMEKGEEALSIAQGWRSDREDFKRHRKPFLLYD
jgi:uncharacterized protein YbbC (DUF1343 family)